MCAAMMRCWQGFAGKLPSPGEFGHAVRRSTGEWGAVRMAAEAEAVNRSARNGARREPSGTRQEARVAEPVTGRGKWHGPDGREPLNQHHDPI